MSKILQGISNPNLKEGVTGAVIGGGLGSQVPKAYNAVADKTGLPKVDPNADPLGAELDTITTVTGAVMGHNTQKNRAAKKEAEKVQQALAQAAQKQTAAAAPAVSNPTIPPKVGSTGQAVKSMAKDIPSLIKNAPTKKIALYTVGAYLVNKGVDALTGQSILDRVENMWNKRGDSTSSAAAPASSTAAPGVSSDAVSSPLVAPPAVSRPDTRTGTQTNPNVKCEIDPVTGTLPPGCVSGVPVYENKISISEGIAIAEANKLKKAGELVGKGYDWLHDLYLKRIGQTTKKDVEDWYKQHGTGTASPILKPGSDFKKGEPITYTDVKNWEDQFKQLSKEQQQELVDKLTKTRQGQRTLAGLTTSGIVGGVGGAMYSGIEKAHDQAISDKPKPEVKPAKPERKREEPVTTEPEPVKAVEPTVEPPVAEPVAPTPEPAQDSNQCVVGGDVLDLSPEECARMKDLTSENISENVNNLINQIAMANKLKDPNLIQIGQRLRLPGNLAYTVKSGDNLTKIAKALMARAGSQQEPMQTFTVSAPKMSNRYPDSGSEQGQQFVDPRNNPGNLRFYKNLNQPGYVLDKAIGVDKNGFAVFATPEDGLDAMRRQIAIDARKGLTGREFISKYAPAADKNDPEIYTKNVFGELGLDPDQPLDPSLIPLIQPLMIRQEHGKEGMYYYMPKTDPRNNVANLTEMEILQRFLDKELNKNQKPVANPNAVPKKPTEPKEPGTTDYSKELELDPSLPRMHPLELERPKVDAEVQKRMQQLQKQKPVKEVKADLINKVIGKGRYVVFNQTTGLRLQTNDVNKAINAAQLMAKKDLNRPTMVYDTETKFPVAAYRGSEEMLQQKNIRHESKVMKKK